MISPHCDKADEHKGEIVQLQWNWILESHYIPYFDSLYKRRKKKKGKRKVTSSFRFHLIKEGKISPHVLL